jgi:diacylglycerol kinase family enzyme/membrane-associated phospholipid phosphatase
MTLGEQTRRRLLVTTVLALVWILAASYLVWQQPHLADSIDHRVGRSLAALTDRHAWLERTAEIVYQAFRVLPVAVVTVATAAVLFARGFRRTAAWVLLASVGSLTTTTLMKLVFERPRPAYAHMHLADAAFPSGHSSGVACAAGIAVMLGSTFLRRHSQRRTVWIVAVVVTLAVGLDRLLLGVHGITDVLTGFAVGVAWVCGSAYVFDPTPRSVVREPLPSALPSTRELAVVLNPAKVEDPEAFRALLNARAQELGWSEPVWFETTVEDTGRQMAHEAAIGGAELVVVCGGDGTVRAVCAELAGTGIPVGVVPAGTGNLLARNLDLPLYLNAALDVALAGQDRAIDIVRIAGDGLGEDEHFLVMAGMGFDAAIMEGASEQIKARVGWLAYFVSGVRNVMFGAVPVEISVDDEPFTRHRARTIVVGNVGFLQAGLPLLPDATIDDGRLDVVLINPRRFLHWLFVLVRVLGRRKKVDDTVNRMTGRKVVVRAAAPTPRQIDGDPVGAGEQLVCECLHGKLLVRVPR